MKMNRSCYTIFFIFLLSTLTTGANLNWFEAQEQCRDRGGLTIEDDKSDQSYWIGRYRRITPWIKIKGCFKDSVLSNITPKLSLSMFRTSVGICQEMCQRHNTTVFAVKAKNCICIEDVSAMFLSESVDPKNCNSDCFLVKNDIYENECGGNSSYNVFEFESNTAIGNSSFGPGTGWTQAMKNCKDAEQPSYLFGNVELQNANLACNSIEFSNNIALFWIGVARQMYLNKDDGWNFGIDQRQSFIECKTSTNNEYQDCLTKMNNSVFCSLQSIGVSTVSSSSLDTRYTTQHETLTIGKNVFVDDTTQNTDGVSTVVAFSLGIVVFVMIVITTIVYLYHRRKLRRSKHSVYVLPAQVSAEHEARGHPSYITLTGLNESPPPNDDNDDSAVYAEIIDSDGEVHNDCYTRPGPKAESNDDYLQPYNILTKTAERLHTYESLKNTIKDENPNSLSENISVSDREEGPACGVGNTSKTDVASVVSA
uniref:Uncharacterized protein LOC111110661 isoform X2 n=1 Tax=Crassostrea virginica TaxID=6565 RepID=A0A8B8BJ44_CRAVI|nr:uncharacterized protein LOC111110661 isoform X2 [Crassostrea virginica]